MSPGTADSRATDTRRDPSRPPRHPAPLHSSRNSASRTFTFFLSLSQGAATFRSPAKTRTSITGRPRRTAYSCSRQAAVMAPSSAWGQSITSGRSGAIAARRTSRTSASWPWAPLALTVWSRPSNAGCQLAQRGAGLGLSMGGGTPASRVARSRRGGPAGFDAPRGGGRGAPAEGCGEGGRGRPVLPAIVRPARGAVNRLRGLDSGHCLPHRIR